MVISKGGDCRCEGAMTVAIAVAGTARGETLRPVSVVRNLRQSWTAVVPRRWWRRRAGAECRDSQANGWVESRSSSSKHPYKIPTDLRPTLLKLSLGLALPSLLCADASPSASEVMLTCMCTHTQQNNIHMCAYACTTHACMPVPSDDIQLRELMDASLWGSGGTGGTGSDAPSAWWVHATIGREVHRR